MMPKYVRDLMTEDVHTLRPADDLATLRDLLYEHDVRHAPVVDAEGDLVGLVSQRDLLRNVLTDQADVPLTVQHASLAEKRVADIMVTAVATVEPDASLQAAAQVLYDYKYGCLPVTEGSRLVGILTEADFVRFFADSE